jgi:uroporphyrinogen decarboxylase
MNSRERVRLALNHKEPDRIPFDLGGTALTSMSSFNYNSTRAVFGLPSVTPRIMDIFQQNVLIDDDFLTMLDCDVRSVSPGLPHSFSYNIREDSSGYYMMRDEWGIGWKKSLENGLYYDMYEHPLAGEISIDSLKDHPWPDPTDPDRFTGLAEKAADLAVVDKRAVTLDCFCSGIVEVVSWLRGYTDFYLDIARDDRALGWLMDKVVEMKQAYWEKALSLVGDNVDVVMEADDMAGQFNLLISPKSYRKIIKPRHKKLFDFIKSRTSAKLFFHSCGAIRPLIPDLIEIGVDILNPVQVNAAGMNSADLKRDFGNEITFWGGGVDTQGAFSSQEPHADLVAEDVNKQITALKPGGGFIFSAVHNIQANVAPENIFAMWLEYKHLCKYE